MNRLSRWAAAAAVFAWPVFAAASPAADGHEGGIVWVSDVFGNEGKMGLLFIFINFAVLLYILERILFAPLRAKTRAKHDAVRGELNEATKAHADAKAMVSKYRERLEGLADEADALMKEARSRADADRKRIIAAAEREAQQIRDSATAAASRESESLRREIEAEVVDQAVARAEQIIVGKINATDQRRMVDEYVAHVAKVDFSGRGASASGGAS